MAYRKKISRSITMLSVALFIVFVFAKDAMTEMPGVPPFETAIEWYPLPDRTLLVQFDNVAFRYQYLTKGDPSFYKETKNKDWLWMSIRTYGN